MSYVAAARARIAPYMGKRVTADLDGSLFDHVPATFVFRFVDPVELRETLAEDYYDYLMESLPCIDEDGEWTQDELVPVAAVGTSGDDDDSPYEFAWLFLDYRAGEPPALLVTTSDDWGEDRALENFDELGLRVG